MLALSCVVQALHDELGCFVWGYAAVEVWLFMDEAAEFGSEFVVVVAFVRVCACVCVLIPL